MKRTIKLTERDLSRIVKRVMNEQDENLPNMDDLSSSELRGGKNYKQGSNYGSEPMDKIDRAFKDAKIRTPRMYLFYALELASSGDPDFNPTYLEQYLSRVLNIN
jgi:hypothetical protein